MQHENSGTDAASRAGKLLRWASWIVIAEAVAVAAFAAFLLWGLISGQAHSIAAEASLVGLYAVAAAWVWYIAYSLPRGKRWARSAAVFWQTCQLFLASQSFTGRGANTIIGVALIVTSVAVLWLVLNPAVNADSKRAVEKEK
jgi:hypothetical protein